MDQDAATELFYKLIWPHRADVLRFAQFLSRDLQTAEDLSQETLLKGFKAVDRLSVGSDVKAWLLMILRNTWVDRLRSPANQPQVSLDEVEHEIAAAEPSAPDFDSDAKPQDVLNEFSDREVIEQLQRLPEEMRWTLLLVDVAGLSVLDAAQVLQVPVGTIKSRTHRGRGLLYNALLPMARQRKLVPDDSEMRQEEP